MTTRRRRLLSDDPEAQDTGSDDRAGDDASTAKRAPEGDAAYTRAARGHRKSGVQDLVPVRYAMIALVAGVGLGLVGLVEGLHLVSASVDEMLATYGVAALGLDGARNISQFLASSLATTAALVAVFIYSLRRHRVDDYYGRYRVWLWAAVICLLAGLMETTDTGSLARAVCRLVADTFTWDEHIVWTATVATLLSLVGLRILFEVRHCRMAIVACLAVAACVFSAATVENSWFVEASPPAALMLVRGCTLSAYVLVVAAFLLYARHVVYEIQGLVAVAPKRRKKHKAASTESADDAETTGKKPAVRLRTDLDSVEKSVDKSAERRHAVASSKSVEQSAPSSLNIDETPHRGVSRAERRRMRRDSKMAS